MISENVWNLTHGIETITSFVAANPDHAPEQVALKLFPMTKKEATKGLFGSLRATLGGKDQTKGTAHIDPTPEDLERTAQCGKFPTRPSDLFLKIYHNILQTLDQDPMANVCSPPLIASSGVVPVSVVSIIKDIMNHYASLIVEAQHEVFLATNYWEHSHASKIITDAFLELSRRVMARGGKKVVVKMMYDRGSVKQFIDNRQKVPESEWVQDAVQLPKSEDIPGLFLEVVNYHRPALGTFHCKYMVIDRRIAVLNSNNIQDMANLEFMTQIEGPIIDGFYDMALWSFGKKMEPPLACLGNPLTEPKGKNGYAWPKTVIWEGRGNVNAAAASELTPEDQLPQQPSGQQGLEPTPASTTTAPQPSDRPAGMSNNEPSSLQPPSEFIPSQESNTGMNTGASVAVSKQPSPEELKAKDKTKSGKDKKKSDGKPEQPLPKGSLDPTATGIFNPALFLEPHDEVPMVLVNRKPHGKPGHGDTFCPQDVAWLTAMRYAQKDVFIQTPDLNTKPIIEAVIECVRRDIEVTLYICVGYNDAGEALPYQGGTNEEVIKKMYAEVQDEYKSNLRVHWYTSKDWNVPINASHKLRNCHVKIMLVDSHIAIQGNGNQDTQSWFHSMEINILIDSELIVRSWRDLIERNQNTGVAGRVGEDGIWRDQQGQVMPDSSGIHSGPSGLVKGVMGSIARVRGTGGF
ncbi:hypothetical protein FRB95_011127 [Tulasnella sp. JGI-2019a]|nr:hypothetical protein FRB95_011127 [Tulasnella sp. JGI-2019a]